MTSPFMKALESRLSNPSFQRGITEMGLSILANNAPSTQPKAGFGATLAQGALRGMDAARQESEYQKAQQQQEAMREAAQEASQGIQDPALRRLAAADPAMARAILMKRYEREITPYQQAQLDQGSRRLDISEEQATADQALAERNFGLKEQGLDLDRQRLAGDAAHRAAELGLDREKFAHDQKTGGAEATKALMTRARKIQDAMRLQGLSEAEATALVDSQTRVVTDPVTGKSLHYNEATGQASDISTPQDPVSPLGNSPEAEGAQPHTIEQMAAQTGVVPTLQDYWARTAGQFDPSVVDAAKAKAMTQQRFVKTQLRSALMNSPRGAVWEQQQIDQLLPEEGVLESPARATEIFRAAKDAVRLQHQFNADQINSGELTSKVEQEMREKNVQLESVYNLLPDPEQVQTPAAAPVEASAQPAEINPAIGQASVDLGVDPAVVMQAAQEAGVSPDVIIEKLRGRAQ